MERSEPSLAPEWLRSTGSGTGGGSASHHFASSHSDGPVSALTKRNRPSRSINSNDAPHSSFLDRNMSSNSRRNSTSNGSLKHDKNPYSRSYSSFTRNNHRERDKERLTIPDHWDAEYSDPLRSMLSGRIEKDSLRRSQSMVSRMQGEVLQRRSSSDFRPSLPNSGDNGNGLSVSGMTTGIQKVTFERDFPSLGSEDRPVTPELSRVPSPGLSRGVQSLSIGNSALISAEGWSSALAEVPIAVGTAPAVQPAAAPSSSGAATSISSGLNMAEALVQAPLRAQTAPQPPVQNQRFEELAVLQSKKLIPMTPSMPKSSVLNPSDKLKPKTGPRLAEPMVGSKNGQLASLQLNSQSHRGGNMRTDAAKTTQTGKLLVLKPGRENGVSITSKDATSPPANANNRIASSQSIGVPTSAPVPLKNPNNHKPFSVERKAQVQSRTDFFNSVRKKSMNNTSVSADSSSLDLSVVVEKCNEEHKDVASDPVNPCVKNDSEVNCNGDAHTTSLSFLCSTDEEEEAAFMRSLGWEPNAEDDEGLTEEEINAFYQEYMKLRPASKLCKGLQSKILTQSETDATPDGAASELSPTDSMN